jgi:nucleotide-binding universal stress UspA family protein
MRALLGIDGTDESYRALERTVERATVAGDDLTVAVIEPPGREVDREAVERRARETLEEAGLTADVRHLHGDPGGALVGLAEAEEYDEIVLGGGETSPMGKIRIGGVTEFVLLNAQVTVKLVR